MSADNDNDEDIALMVSIRYSNNDEHPWNVLVRQGDFRTRTLMSGSGNYFPITQGATIQEWLFRHFMHFPERLFHSLTSSALISSSTHSKPSPHGVGMTSFQRINKGEDIASKYEYYLSMGPDYAIVLQFDDEEEDLNEQDAFARWTIAHKDVAGIKKRKRIPHRNRLFLQMKLFETDPTTADQLPTAPVSWPPRSNLYDFLSFEEAAKVEQQEHRVQPVTAYLQVQLVPGDHAHWIVDENSRAQTTVGTVRLPKSWAAEAPHPTTSWIQKSALIEDRMVEKSTHGKPLAGTALAYFKEDLESTFVSANGKVHDSLQNYLNDEVKRLIPSSSKRSRLDNLAAVAAGLAVMEKLHMDDSKETEYSKGKLDLRVRTKSRTSSSITTTSCSSSNCIITSQEFQEDQSAARMDQSNTVTPSNMSTRDLVSRNLDDEFACSYCGVMHFDTVVEAVAHQKSCDGSGNKLGPWKCTACGAASFRSLAAFRAHQRSCMKQSSTVSSKNITLRPVRWYWTRARLSDFNYLVTNSIDLIQATQSDIDTMPRRNRRRNPNVGDIGIRCIYCVGRCSIASISFPDHIRTLAHNLYLMADRHLLSSCPNIPHSVRQKMKEARPYTTKQSTLKDRIGLPAYLQLLIDDYGLIDKGNSCGIQWKKKGTKGVSSPLK